jgi:hypothetical protein
MKVLLSLREFPTKIKNKIILIKLIWFKPSMGGGMCHLIVYFC